MQAPVSLRADFVQTFQRRRQARNITRFEVDPGDLDLPEGSRETIAEDLQKPALAHPSRVRFKDLFAIRFPKDWWG